jgi:hypothetical protein
MQCRADSSFPVSQPGAALQNNDSAPFTAVLPCNPGNCRSGESYWGNIRRASSRAAPQYPVHRSRCIPAPRRETGQPLPYRSDQYSTVRLACLTSCSPAAAGDVSFCKRGVMTSRRTHGGHGRQRACFVQFPKTRCRDALRSVEPLGPWRRAVPPPARLDLTRAVTSVTSYSRARRQSLTAAGQSSMSAIRRLTAGTVTPVLECNSGVST